MLILERQLTPAQFSSEPHEALQGGPFWWGGPDPANPDEAGSVVVLEVMGDLTDPTCELHQRVESLMEQGEQAIVVNLAQVTGWSYKGLGELARCFTSMARRGRRFGVINPPPRLRAVVGALKML